MSRIVIKTKGVLNAVCFSLGLAAGMVMRDEIYYPNLQRATDLVEHHEKIDRSLEEEIAVLKLALAQSKSKSSSKSKANNN